MPSGGRSTSAINSRLPSLLLELRRGLGLGMRGDRIGPFGSVRAALVVHRAAVGGASGVGSNARHLQSRGLAAR